VSCAQGAGRAAGPALRCGERRGEQQKDLACGHRLCMGNGSSMCSVHTAERPSRERHTQSSCRFRRTRCVRGDWWARCVCSCVAGGRAERGLVAKRRASGAEQCVAAEARGESGMWSESVRNQLSRGQHGPRRVEMRAHRTLRAPSWYTICVQSGRTQRRKMRPHQRPCQAQALTLEYVASRVTV